MTSKQTKPDPNVLRVQLKPGETAEHALAEASLDPVAANAATSQTYAQLHFGEVDLMAAVEVTREKVKKVQAGDLSGVEATLLAQAEALDVIFNGLARRAAMNMGVHMGSMDTYLRLALKAQSQCRTTLETLAEIKFPKSATFIKQANIAQQQQVNNGQADSRSNTHAHEKDITPTNELLEASHGERLDYRAQSAAGGVNSGLETVGAVNGAKH